MKLFTPIKLGDLQLANRVVMAPMTRSRAIDNIPNDLMADYYAQRAEAGLIITEGTSPSPNGLGYPRIPGAFSDAQMEGWKKVTSAVHSKGGKIFLQLMHTGRVSHPLNMALGAEILAPSAVELSGKMYTDQEGEQSYPLAKEMTSGDIAHAIDEYVKASKNAVEAGFDGVELHGANGYLIEQFLNPASNKRTDQYGGTAENRNRFAIEVATKVVAATGGKRTGIRLSPGGVFNDMDPNFEGMQAQYKELAAAFAKLGLIYIHLVDHGTMGAPAVPSGIKETISKAFGGAIIASGGLDKMSANEAIDKGYGTLAAFGRPYLANPDLVYRMEHNLELNQPDFDTFYTPGEKGYTDYPKAKGEKAYF